MKASSRKALPRSLSNAFCLTLWATCACAQEVQPGRVAQSDLWLRTGSHNDTLFFQLHSSQVEQNGSLGESSLHDPAVRSINHHLIPHLNYSAAHWLVGDTMAPEGHSTFIVERPIDDAERTLWSLEVADTGRLVLTSLRAVDLTNGMHLTNTPQVTGPVKLINHQHRAGTPLPGRTYLRLGHSAPVPIVPSAAFEGTIAEALFYARVLSPKEQSRVSSYLAIKYGITLAGEDYVSSTQQRVWSCRANANFSHNILAIARDSLSALDQRQSSSSNEEGFLVLGHDTITRWHHEHPIAPPDGHYLICGDDGKPRTWAPRRSGQPQVTDRTWHVERTGPSLLNTRLRLSTDMFANEPTKKGSFWLLIDRSGRGEFGPSSTEPIRAASVDDSHADFADVVWDIDLSGSDRFRFAAGGPFIPLTWVDAPTCELPTMGSITIRVPGGEAPIFCRLEGIGHEAVLEASVAADTTTTITGLAPGEYELTITDASGYVLTDHLWIEPKDAPVIPLQARYELKAEEPLRLDAHVDGAFVSYEWSLEGSVVGNMPQLLVERPGTYTCTVVSDGCPARKSAEVFTSSPEGGIGLGIMPNPTTTGDFVVQVSLPPGTDATMTIASMQGVHVRQRALRGQEFHRVHEHLDGAGEYIISIRTSEGQRYARVIVL